MRGQEGRWKGALLDPMSGGTCVVPVLISLKLGKKRGSKIISRFDLDVPGTYSLVSMTFDSTRAVKPSWELSCEYTRSSAESPPSEPLGLLLSTPG